MTWVTEVGQREGQEEGQNREAMVMATEPVGTEVIQDQWQGLGWRGELEATSQYFSLAGKL